jgi:hypothetical protein
MVRSGSDKEKQKVYKYVHKEDIYIETNLRGLSFNNDFLSITEDGRITVKGSSKKGYAWDGCSPKINFIHLLWGTPDGKLDYRTEKPMTYYASMIHDVIYQFKGEVCVSRKDADIIFRVMLKEANFMWWWAYSIAVRIGGGLYGSWLVKKGHRKDIKIIKYSWLLTPEELAMRDLKTVIEKSEIKKNS